MNKLKFMFFRFAAKSDFLYGCVDGNLRSLWSKKEKDISPPSQEKTIPPHPTLLMNFSVGVLVKIM